MRKIIILFLLFAVIAISLSIPLFSNIDTQVSLFLYNSLNFPILIQFFNLVTNYTLGSLIGVAVISLYILVSKKYIILFKYLFGIIFTESLIFFLKIIVNRVRPFDNPSEIIYLGNVMLYDFSFPSGHTTLAFFSAYFVCKSLRLNRKISSIIYFLAFLVGLSRIAIGAHYVLDVIAGAILGTISGILVELIFNKSKDILKKRNS